MQKESRSQKSILNAKVGLIFYFLITVVTFFSRKIFLDCLGPDFVGLTGTLYSILSVLNLTEFGVGSSIAYFLYAPIAKGDHEQINEIVSVCGYLYRIVGTIILIIGIIVSALFPIIFSNTIFGLSIVFFAFYCILGSSLIGYYINYKNQLLYADQRQYLIQGYFQTGNILKNILQIIISLYYKNLYLWVSLEIIYNIVCCVILNYKIKKNYPWLIASVAEGKRLFPKYKHILTKCKQIFVYNFKGFLLNKSDELFIFAFVSLKMVAFYGNYTLLVGKLAQLIRIPFNGMLASVGNLVADADKEKTKSVFWELLSIFYCIAAITTIGMYFYITPLIIVWLGNEYIMDTIIVSLLCANTFISTTYIGVYYFNHAYGNYDDVWASWGEAFLNISVTLLTAWKWGIIGILLGKLISTFVFLVIWKPILLYKKGFKQSISEYWRNIALYIIVIIIYITIMYVFKHLFPISDYTFPNILKDILYIYTPITILFTILFLQVSPGGKQVFNRFRKIISIKCI